MSAALIRVSLRLRAPAALIASAGMVAVLLAVGALFPSVGHAIGRLSLPQSVVNLLGGADYATVTGWFRSEIGSVYGPLVVGSLAISGAAALTAGEEEERIMALLLSYPVSRTRLLAARAVAVMLVVAIISIGILIGLLAGVAAAGGGIAFTHMVALTVQIAGFGLAVGALALALAAASGRRSLAVGVSAAVAVLGWLVNSFAPLVSDLGWLRYLSFFHYYAAQDPLGRGFDLPGLAVLLGIAVLLTGLAALALERRDLRG